MSPLGGKAQTRGAAAQILYSASGIGVAVYPVAVLAISARLLSESDLGLLSLALALGAFVGQLLAAGIVESRLASSVPSTSVRLPLWVCVISIAACLAVGVAPHPAVLTVGLPITVATMVAGRSVAVANSRSTSEVLSAGAIIASSSAALLLIPAWSEWVFAIAMTGPIAATLTRWPYRTPRLPAPDRRALFWVTIDAATTGVTQPYLNVLLFALLGPAAAIAFRAVSTVSAGLEPIISALRLRMLRAHSRVEYMTSVALAVGAVLVALLLDQVGIIGAIMGASWVSVTALILFLALLSRVVTLITTPHFAALRRAARSGLAYALRLGSTALYVAFSTLGVVIGSVPGAFLGMVLAELVTALAFWLAARRVRGGNGTKGSLMSGDDAKHTAERE